MKTGIKAFALSLALILLILAALPLLLRQSYLLFRYNPDFSLRTGYLEPEILKKERWTSMEQTSYENGLPVSRTVFQRTLFSHYTVTHRALSKEPVVVKGQSTSRYSRFDYVEEYDRSKGHKGGDDSPYRYASSEVVVESDGTVVLVHASSGYACEAEPGLYNWIRIAYDENGNVIRQSKEEPYTALLGYVLWQYDAQNRLVRIEEYDPDDTLLRYSDVAYDGNATRTTTYASDGTLESYVDTQTGIFGSLKSRTAYDAWGSPVREERYHYRFWEAYQNLFGYVVVALVSYLSAMLGLRLYKEWKSRE